MFEGHYIDWTNTRMNTMKKYVKSSFFRGKKLLELGGGRGHNGNEFSKLGCVVTSTEIRKEHLEDGKKLHPNLVFKQFDCNTQKISKHYDIILHWGVLYHIENVKAHLENVLQRCNYLFLETEVVDSHASICPLVEEEDRYDQAFHKVGSRPSPVLIEEMLKNDGFDYKMITDSMLNSGFHRYDWPSQNSSHFQDGLRRFWICWKASEPSPLS